jgi:hypothetical protein
LSDKGGFYVKVVQASTPCQEEEIKKLIKQVYSEVFPIYFSDKEIQTYEKCNVLYMSTNHLERFSTLKEAYQVIASLQTLITILKNERFDDQYIEIFYKNVSTLVEYDLYFPFEYEHFSESKMRGNDSLSMYRSAANEILV